MTHRQAHYRWIKYLRKESWENEYKHIEILTITTYGRRAGGMRSGGRTRLIDNATLRDEVGESLLEGVEKDTDWVEWTPPEDVGDRAKEFGWKTFKPKSDNPYAK